MLERVTRNECFDLFLHAARKLGVEVRFLVDESTPLAEFSYEGRSAVIYENCTDLNDAAAFRVVKNKLLTSQLLREHGLPVPRSVLLPQQTPMRDLERLVADLQRPLVVKPSSGSGGKGVSVNLASPTAVRKAVQHATENLKGVIVEEYVSGDNFRIVVMDGKVLHVVRRDPAFVVGDGELNIGALIEQKNKRRREVGTTHRISRKSLIRIYLRERGLSLRSTPAPGERVVLHEVCNFGIGGENEMLPLSEVHPDNLDVFKRCAEPLSLRLAGLDFITPNIRKSYSEVGGAFNEISASPMLSYVVGLEYDTTSSIEVLRRRLEV